VVQCAGNGRGLYNKAAKVKGTDWGKGGMGNVRFEGVPLAAVLDHFGVKPTAEAKYLTATGKDGPGVDKPVFEHSVPLDEALRKGLLALKLNGKPLAAVHGGPVRLVMPGYYATMSVKWLARLRFQPDETTNDFQFHNYRMPLRPIKPGTDYQFAFANSRPTWNMKIVSYLVSPADGARVPAGKATTFRGIAFNDGEAAITTVELSFDQGKTWLRADIPEAPAGPYAWRRWQLNHTLPEGRHTVRVRAVDAQGRSQPDDGTVFWNPHGYEWNGVDRVEVTAG